MKRTLLDITNIINRNVVTAYLKPLNLSDGTYSIWIAGGYRFADVIREIEIRKTQSRVKVRINTQYINSKDFVIEQGADGILVKFIKSNFEYPLDTLDEIILSGDIEKYA